MVQFRIFPLVALALSCALLVNGCRSHARLPSEYEEKSIQQKIESPLLREIPSLPQLSPMGIRTGATRGVTSPGWVRRGLEHSLEPTKEFVQGGGREGGLGALGILLGAATLGSAGGFLSAARWRPCLDRLARELQNLGLPSLLKGHIAETLRQRNLSPIFVNEEGSSSSTQPLKSVLEVQVVRVQLREIIDQGNFCLEMAFQARLSESRSTKILYDQTLLYSHPRIVYGLGGSPLDPKEESESARLFTFPQARPMEAYCGPGGLKIIGEEVRKGVISAVERVFDDLDRRSGKLVTPRFVAAEIVEESPTASVPDEVRTRFRQILNTNLYGEGGFHQGPGLIIKYRIVFYQPESKGTFSNSEKGAMIIEALFIDQGNKELAKLLFDGSLGYFIRHNSLDLTMKLAAKKIAAFAKSNFH